MNVVEFLASLAKLDIRLWLEGENLRFSAPDGAFTPEIKQQVVANKAEIVKFLRQAKTLTEDPIEAVDRSAPLVLSYGQQRLWILDQLNPRDVTYNMSSSLRIKGGLNVDVLEKVFQELVKRHESLRTYFSEEDGNPVQVIAPADQWRLIRTSLKAVSGEEQEHEVRRCVNEESITPYDLSTGPLFRAQLLELADDHYVLVAGMHHIISDAWSMEVLVKELTVLYMAFSAAMPSPLPALDIQYADYAGWQRKQMESDQLQKQLNYWSEQLAGAPTVLSIPTDRPRQELTSSNGALLKLALPDALSKAIGTTCTKLDVTPFMFFLGAWQLLLGRYGSTKDVVIGAPIAGRSRNEVQELIGFFVNLLLMRVDLSGNPSLSDYFARVKEMTLGAFSHQDLPIDMLMEHMQVERQPGFPPLAQVAFQLINIQDVQSENPFGDAPVQIEPIPATHVAARMDMVMGVAQTGDSFALNLEYNTDLFNESTVSAMVDQYQFLLNLITQNLEQPIDEIAFYDDAHLLQQLGFDAQQHQLVPLNANQISMFLDEQSNPDSIQNAYGIYVDVNADIDVNRLKAAVEQVVQANPVLRMTLVESDLVATDVAYGVVGPKIKTHLMSLDVDSDDLVSDPLHQKTLELMHKSYDVLNDDLIQFYLLYYQNRARLVVACHHILLDGASTHIVVQQILEAYTSGAAPATDEGYLAHLANVSGRSDSADTLGYWQEQAQKVEPLAFSLPTDRQQLQAASLFGDHTQHFQLDKYQVATVREYCAANGINLPLYFKTLFGIALQQYCRPEAGFAFFEFFADRAGQWRDSLGCFYQQFPSVVDGELLKTNTMLKDWFSALKQQRENSRAHRSISLQAQNHLFKRSRAVFMFNYYNFVSELAVTGEPVVPVMSAPKVDGGVQFIVKDLGATVELELRYDTSVFTDLSFLPRLSHLNEQILHDEIERVSQLHFLSAAEQMQIHSVGANQPHGDNVVTRFEEAALRYGNKVALISGDETLTYEELNKRANQLANYLIERGVSSNVRVGVALNRSIDLMVSVLGVLKAGGAYIPLDPDYPRERLAFIVSDSAAPLVISVTQFEERLGKVAGELLLLDQTDEINQASAENPGVQIDAQQQIYVIYTSGSTGQPKGAMVTHSGEANLQNWYIESLGLTEADRTLLVSAVGFDLSQKNLFAPLLVGAAIVMPRMELFDEQELLELIHTHSVTWVNCAPSAFYPLVETSAANGFKQLQSLRFLVLGGEPIRLSTLYPWLTCTNTKVQLINSYGPTECTDVVAYHKVQLVENENQIIPIGKPINNTQLHVLNDNLQQVVPGCVGEICITGAGVGLGYIGRDELTASVFLDSPFGEGKLYKTGDLGRFRSDGTVEYVGRKDFQIKLRGLRIELGEIEHALKQLTGVQDGLVLVEEEKLIAFVVTSDGQVVEDWRAQLREYLPEYMIPSVAVGVERWPLTPNGKIDRKALPSASSVIQQQNVYVAPRTEMETQVAAIWEQVLQKQNIGVLDNLFEIGGNSLLATRIVSRVKKQFDVAVSVRDLFLAPTVSEFASVIGRSKQIGQLPEIEVSDYSQPLPVSYAQQRLWFLNQLDANNTAYNMPGAFRVSGKLNEDAFEQAVGEIVARHGVLRSRIIEHEDVPVQQIDAKGSGFFKLVDLSALPDERQALAIDQHVDSLYRHVFDFANGPLFYVSLLRLAEDEHILLVNMHHIVSDGWSNGILMRELGVLYDAFEHGRSSPLPELKIQYADFSKWQRNWLRGDELERQVSYWRENLAGVEILNLPTSYPRTVNTGFAGNVLSFDIDGQLTAKLKRLSQHSGASLYMTTLAAYMVLLSKYSHQDDISVGSPIANRNHEDIEPLIGFFVNTLVMRASVDPSASFESLLKQIQTNTLQAYSHQDVPFEKLVDELVTERDMLHAPLFQVLFSLQNVPVDTDFTLPGLKLSGISNHNVVSKFDLEFSLMEQGGIIKAEVVYRTELFSKRYVERLIDHYLMLLNAITEDASQPINQLTMLTQQDVAKLHSWNLTETPYDKTATIHQLFEAQAQQSPHAKALICGSNSLTYAELNDRANQFAHMLQAHNVSSGDTVGIMLPRSMGLMIAVMGALKAGASYLPLDPSYPKDRLAYMLADSGAVCVVGNEPMDGVTQSFIQFDDSQSQLASYPTDAVSVSVTSDSLLYVIYTSGSTGRPKGTGATHRAEVNLLNWYCREFSMGPSDRVLLVSAIGFDLTQKNLFAPLVSGAALVIPEIHEYDPMHLLECIQKHHVSWINCAPNAFYPLVEESTPNDLQSLRYVFLGGEPIDFDRLKNWLQNASAKLVNSYGPTECADIATYHVVDDVDAYNSSSIPIGKAIDNVKLYVLDELQRMVPEGVPGELCIGGDGVGPGYFNDQAQTEEKFIANPFSQTEDTLYRTGDLVRYLADGEIEYLGRIDSQVKIRGFRIEPGEIENHLRQIPAVNASCVIALPNQQGVKELVAYLVCDEESLDIEHVRQQLKAKLPDFMVPPFFVVLDALPLTPNGKVAKNLLPAPDRTQVVERDIIEPANDIEQHILSVWQSVLGVEEISTADDFFAVGGHSLLATQVVSRIRKHYRVNLALRSLFEAPTIQNIAQQVELALGQQQQALPPITAVDRSGALPLSFVQQQLWLLDQLDPGTPAYNMPVALMLKGDLDVAAFENSFNRVIERHETLRTNFEVVDGNPVAVIQNSRRFSLEQMDLSGRTLDQQKHELESITQRMLETGFDLKRDALMRGALVKLSNDDEGNPQSAFVGAIHHIVSDGWSLNIMTAELLALYQAEVSGMSPVLPELSVQYVDVAAWQRQWLSGEVLAQHIEFWRTQLDHEGQVLDLVTDFPRPAVLTSNGASVAAHLSADVVEKAKSLAQEEGATLFMVLMSVYQLLLARYSGQQRINVGTPIAGRDDVETENLVGFFINTVVISTKLDAQLTCRQLLRTVREVTLNAYAHQALPFEKIVEELKPPRDPSRTPFFQVFLNLLNLPPQAAPGSGLAIEPLIQEQQHNHAKYDFNLYVSEELNRGLELLMVYNSDLYREGTVKAFMADFVGLFERFVSAFDSNAFATSSRVLPNAAWYPNLNKPIEKTISESPLVGFLKNAHQQGERIAIESEAGGISYAELEEQSRAVAAALVANHVHTNDTVAILAARNTQLIVSLLGVLRAGAAFTVLDSTYPIERLQTQLELVGPKLIINGLAEAPDALLDGLSEFADLVPFESLKSTPKSEGFSERHNPESIAYVAFTSGSTGVPKAIQSDFVPLSHFVHWYSQRYQFDHIDRFTMLSGLGHDPLLRDIFTPLSVGASICIPSTDWLLNPKGFLEWLDAQTVSVAHLTPSMGQVMLSAVQEDEERQLDHLRLLVFGGDRFKKDVVSGFRQLTPNAQLVNAYGATETPQIMALYEVPAIDETASEAEAENLPAVMPVGKAAPGVELIVADELGQSLPPGFVGEIQIRTPYLSRGYLHDDDTSRFYVNALTDGQSPTDAQPDRIYRTGDKGRYREDGTVEFLGRLDDQIKIRGFRVEPAEVERQIAMAPEVSQAAVILSTDPRGDDCLVAYLVCDGGTDVSDSLRMSLRKTLPEYMVPALFVPVDSIPLTANGKVDKRKLPDSSQFWSTKEYIAPRTETEMAIAEIWQQVLKLDKIGVDEHFFDVGGHSLLAVQIVTRVKEQYDVEFSMRRLMEVATIEGMASYVENALWLRDADSDTESADDDDFEELEI